MADFAQTISTAYAVDGAALDLGRGVLDGEVVAAATVKLPLRMVNRHGLIAGATGTGKTKTLQGIAEQLSTAGVPVFVADVKGDLSGIADPGTAGSAAEKRAHELGLQFEARGFPVEFFSLGGIGPGIPIRATVSDFGPQLMAKVLGANETQEQSLSLVFHYADQKGLPLLDLSDLRALLSYLASDEGKADLTGIGGLSSATVGVLLRSLTGLEDGGGNEFFGEPMLDIHDLMRAAPDGRGIISCLELPAVQDKPKLFSTALMWLLAELFEELPEAGDLDKPKLAFFFDEAHLLFEDAVQVVPDLGGADGPADPLQGGGRLLRHPDPQGRAQRDPRPARQPGSARPAGVHARGRQGAQGHRLDVPEVVVLRPGDPADQHGHRRGRGHDPVRDRRAHPRGAHPDRAARLADGTSGRRRGPGPGVPAVGQVRPAGRQPERAGDPGRPAGGPGPGRAGRAGR